MRKLSLVIVGLAGLLSALILLPSGEPPRLETSKAERNNEGRGSTVDQEPANRTDTSSPKIHVKVVTEDWKPFSFEEDGVVKGSSTEIVRQVLDRMGADYSFKVYPWARAYSMAREDENTLIFAIVRTPEREPLFRWVGQVAPTDQSSFYKLRSRDDIVINSLEDTKPYTIVTNRDSDKHQFLVANGFEKIILESDQVLTVKLFLSGRTDLLIMHDINLLPHLEALEIPLEKLERVLVAFESRPFMAFSKRTSDDIVNKSIESYIALVKEGEIGVIDHGGLK